MLRIPFSLFADDMVELWTRNREMGDEDEYNMEDTSGYEKSGDRLA